MNAEPQAPAIRIDRWLCAARAYRTRSLAAEACDGGKVAVNGAGAKPHKLVRPGDVIEMSGREGTRTWRVLDIAERRGPARVARTLYQDLTPLSPPPDLAMPRRERGTGRPTKRERRRLDRFF